MRHLTLLVAVSSVFAVPLGAEAARPTVSIGVASGIVTAGQSAYFEATTKGRWCRIAARANNRTRDAKTVKLPSLKVRVSWKVSAKVASGSYAITMGCAGSRKATARASATAIRLVVRGKGGHSVLAFSGLSVRAFKAPAGSEQVALTDVLPPGTGDPSSVSVDQPLGVGGGGFASYYPLDTGYRVRITEGPGGRYSHSTVYTRNAIDLGVPSGTVIRAGFIGVVARVNTGCAVGNRGCGDGYGNYIYLKATDGTCAVMGHLSTISVSPGQQVNQYDALATSGNTGNSTGAHLHYDRVDCSNNRSLPWSPQEGGSVSEGSWVTSQNSTPPGNPSTPPPTPFTFSKVTPSLAATGIGPPSNAFPGDFNGDGKADLAWYENGRITFYISNGNTVSPSLAATGIGPPTNAFTGDFNGDGKTDLAWYENGRITFYISNGSTVSPSLALNGIGPPTNAFTGDFNGDGKTDLAWYENGRITVYQSNGTTASPSIALNGIGTPTNAFTGDFNGDGKTDLAWYENGRITFYISNGSALSPTLAADGIGPPSNAFTGDFNGDGKTDLAWYENGRITVYQSTGTTVSPSIALSGIGAPENALSGDFNGDGKTDLAWYENGRITFYLSTGSALAATLAADGIGAPTNAFAGDFNGDGKTDLAWYENGRITFYTSTAT